MTMAEFAIHTNFKLGITGNRFCCVVEKVTVISPKLGHRFESKRLGISEVPLPRTGLCSE